MIQAQFRPIDNTKPLAAKQGWERSPFSASWTSTLNLLEREIRHLAGKDIVIEIDTTLSQIRNDGWPYSSAKVGRPGVRISFASKHGPMSYTSVQYARWETNIHAVALTLERLRAVERYGCVKNAEQYQGFSALPPGRGGRSGIQVGEWSSCEDAARFLLSVWGGSYTEDDIQATVHDPTGTWRDASKKVHPDLPGGSEAMMSKVNRAREFIQGEA